MVIIVTSNNSSTDCCMLYRRTQRTEPKKTQRGEDIFFLPRQCRIHHVARTQAIWNHYEEFVTEKEAVD